MHATSQRNPATIAQLLYICTPCLKLKNRGFRIKLEANTSKAISHPARTLSEPRSEQLKRALQPDTPEQSDAARELADSDKGEDDVTSHPDSVPVGRAAKRRRRRVRKPKAPDTDLDDGDSHAEPVAAESTANAWVTIKSKNLDRSKTSATSNNQPGTSIERTTSGLNNNMKREQCVMVFRLPEPQDDSSSDRYDADVRAAQDMVNKLLDAGEEGVTLLRAIRIGKRIPESQLPRPLKLVLKTKEEASRLLSRAYRLNGRPWLRPDMAPEDRDKQKAALAELKERTSNGEQNLHIRNFRVVRKKLRKDPILLKPGGPYTQT